MDKFRDNIDLFFVLSSNKKESYERIISHEICIWDLHETIKETHNFREREREREREELAIKSNSHE